MRITRLAIISTAHLPEVERDRVDALITSAPRGPDGRVVVDHPGVSLEPTTYGFLAYADEPGCEDLPTLDRLLKAAVRDRGTNWVLFDRDEPAHPDLDIFAEA